MATRTAVPGDESIIASLLSAFNLEFDTWTPPRDVLVPRFERLLRSPEVLILLALEPDPVGFALVTTRPSPYYDGPIATLDELYLAPERRGRGLGSELIAHLAEEARTRGVGEIQINVDEGDLDTRRFYDAHGFTNFTDRESDERMLCYIREL